MRPIPAALAFLCLSLAPATAQDWAWSRVGYEWSGSVDLSADVDGDGRADVVIGNELAPGGGEVQVCSGPTGLTIHVVGGGALTDFGCEVVGLSDMNGDGFDEFGAASDWVGVMVHDGASGAALDGLGAGNGEISLDSIGDVNGDGVDDIVVGNPSPSKGEVFIVSGRWILDDTPPIYLWQRAGSTTGGRFGEDVVAIGDVNGDGVQDVVVGAPEEEGVSGLFAYHGQVHCLSGADGATLWTKRWYATVSTRFGGSVGWIGDYDGDGVDDALVGAPWNDSSALDGGAFFILNGLTGGYLLQYYHPVAGDLFGSDVAGIGDMDLDGVPEYLVGAEGDNNGLGSASLHSGLTGVPFWKYDGFGFLGRRGTLTGGADASGDGVGDFVLSSPGGGFGLGRVEMFFGTCPGGSTPYCQSGVNSTGQQATLHVMGSVSIASNSMLLEARKCPPGNLGVFMVGATSNQTPFGDGWLCLGGTVARLLPAQLVDDFGFAQLTPDLQAAPFDAGALAITPGDTRYFQFWYRDPDLAGGSGFNLTNGRQVTFCP